jgi:2-dehydro-3-deoxyphosphogalactonate aldolase
MTPLSYYLNDLPLIAILRGITPDDAIATADVLYESGFRVIEVPFNSPHALDSVARMAKHLPSDCLLGAGTVLSLDQVQQVCDAGGNLIVMPHADTRIISHSKQSGCLCVPGVATLTEAFAALDAGADALKIFPSDSVPPNVLKAWRTVLPDSTICLPVGGVKADAMLAYIEVGADGFGLGSHLYKAGMRAQQVRENALAYVHAWRELQT